MISNATVMRLLLSRYISLVSCSSIRSFFLFLFEQFQIMFVELSCTNRALLSMTNNLMSFRLHQFVVLYPWGTLYHYCYFSVEWYSLAIFICLFETLDFKLVIGPNLIVYRPILLSLGHLCFYNYFTLFAPLTNFCCTWFLCVLFALSTTACGISCVVSSVYRAGFVCVHQVVNDDSCVVLFC